MLSNKPKMNSVRCPKPPKISQKRKVSKIQTMICDNCETVRDGITCY